MLEGDRAYPWKAEFREKDKNSQFILLKDKKNKVLGYALYSEIDRHVHDVAVDPEYKAYSKHMLLALLKRMKETSDKPWKAEYRESTSLALLEKLANRGTIRLEKMKDSYMGIKGEGLHKVLIHFDVADKEDRRQLSAKNDTLNR